MPPRSRDEIGADEAISATSRERAVVVASCRQAHPDLQALYLFGSRASDAPRPHSDFDLALLLPPERARGVGCLPLSELRPILERELGQEVDLVNLRIAPTVFAKEIVATGERIDCGDPAAADDFEALTFSLYQELNVERAEILRDFEQTGIAFAPSAAPPVPAQIEAIGAVVNDVVLNKIEVVQRCVHRAREERASAGDAFRSDFSRQDAAVMNVVRACEATIDLANVVVRKRRAGVPNTSADAFRLLVQIGVLEEALGERLARMVGFRNVAVHAYRALDLDIVEHVLQEGLDDLLACCERLRRASS